MTKFAGVAGVAGVYLPAYAGRETVKNDRQCVFNTFSPGQRRGNHPRDPRNPCWLTRKEQVTTRVHRAPSRNRSIQPCPLLRRRLIHKKGTSGPIRN
jgi:hypothetical protein